ncbi:MAG: FlgD immunoglobulin-like domain containing protein, partial [Candidatus Latescibacteria bacterium]|nr:FlgD immunoglobulin-like domain containing protein [Candidatus Latescibacterota bacterium]
PRPPTENGLYFSSMELVDLNNDGDLDILVAGANDFGSQIKYLDNNLNSVGLGVFGGVGIRLLTETQSNNGSITAADFDGDNDVDFVVNGSKRSAAGVELPSTVVFESTNAQFFNVNRAPNDPSALTAVVDTTSSVVLKWDAVTDVQNGSSVTYSLRVGTTIDGDEIKSGAWPIGLGNVGYNRSMPLHSLADGQYFWAVKSVDHAFMASSWTSGGEFTVDTEPPAVAALRGRGGGKDTLRIGIDGEITLTIAFDDGDVGTGMDTENIDMTVRVSSSSSNLETTDIDTLVSDGSWDAAGVLWTGRLTVSADFDTGAVDNVYVHLHSARDKRGNTMPDTAFATLLIIDTVRPSVNLSATYPRAGQTVPTSRNLNVVFDEPMAESSVAAANVRVKGVGGSWTRTGATTGSLDPNDQDFQPNREYFLVIPGSVVDLASNAIGDDIEIPFKTPSKVTRDGGTVANSDSTATMYVPPSRDAADVEMFFDDPDLAVTPASDPSGGRSTGLVHVVASEPARDFVGAPALLTVHYPDAIGRLASIQASEDSLRLFYADTTGSAAKWTFVGGTIDPDANTLVAPIEHLGTYRLFLGGLPDGEVISLSDLDCQPRVFKAIGLSDLRAATSVLFSLQQDADVTVRVFNRTGRLVRTVADNQSFTAGRNTIDWDGRDEDGGTVASGTYAISVVGDGQQAVKVVAVVNK